MSHEPLWSSATHRVYTGIINEFLIKGATALTLQVGVLTRPILTSGSCAVTLRSHQNIIKLSQHAHSTVISLSVPRLTSPPLFFFLSLFSLETGDHEPPSQIAAETTHQSPPRRPTSPSSRRQPARYWNIQQAGRLIMQEMSSWLVVFWMRVYEVCERRVCEIWGQEGWHATVHFHAHAHRQTHT